MKTEIVTITPAMAEKWLKGTTSGNRPVRRTHVKSIAAQIEKGQWQLNGESIIVDDNGNIVDGQHRLLAIIHAGKSVDSIVVRGVNPDSFKTIDSGATRQAGDVLTLSGYKSGKALAAAINCIHACYASNGFYDTPRTTSGSQIQLTKVDYLRLVKEYDGCADSVSYIHARSNSVAVFRPGSFASAMHYIFGTENALARDAFFNAIANGLPHFTPSDSTVRLRKSYENTAKAREMKASAKCRYQTWRTAWDQFVVKYEREQRPLRFSETVMDASPRSRRLGVSI